MGYKVAVVGATGNVGREMLKTMYEREFPADEVVALASHRSVGKEISYGDDDILKCQDLETYDFKGTDIVLSSAGASISAKFAPRATAAGAVIVDNTSHFRMDPGVPLVIPEVNPEAIAGYTKKGIIANPNCSTIQMLVALKPLHDMAKIERVVVATYQSVSGGGKSAMDELFNQTRGVYMNQDAEENREVFTKQIAFNIIPQIDKFMDDGMTKEEWKMVVETKKILDPDIEVCASCVRVPVFIGHAEMINVEFTDPISVEEATNELRESPGVVVVDDVEKDGGYVTPAECAGEDAVFISRLRKDASVLNGLNFWCVSDNLRKGAALNTVQIAEILASDYLGK